MGYNTKYRLEVMNHTNEDLDYMDFILEREECPVSITENIDVCKWYEHEEDMKRVSKKFPDLVFKLDGEGEESGDIWRKYFKNGKMQDANTKVKIEHDPFDEELLK